MEVLSTLLNIIAPLVTLLGGDATNNLFHVQGSTACTSATCPGSFYTAVTVAWANIGYMTHADVLDLVNNTNFGAWGIIFYIVAAIGGFIGVATNSPMRNWTWFLLGPALYGFLVGTTQEVQGVNWVVAGKPVTDMSDVWRIAEVGLSNTRLATATGKVSINGKDGPDGMYEVAYPMVFLDELFSVTSNALVYMAGIQNQTGTGATNSNLAAGTGRLTDGPWWLLSTLKWPMLENIVGVTARDPSLRDALVTFLGSECGDKFKEGIDSGAFIAATQAQGAVPVPSVMIETNGGTNYTKFQSLIDPPDMPTPRALNVVFKGYRGTGSFQNFSPKVLETLEKGQLSTINCSTYLWMIIQGLRWEAGHSYYQLIRSAPKGFTEEEFIKTLFYGWDIRPNANSPYASQDEQAAFVKHLILAYLLRNELLYAPQITSYDQRYAPSEQSKSFGDAYVRTAGSKMKYTELYNAAVMMPYIQGILAFLLIAGYPLATMLVILPSHYKGFFTWVAFFAWIKLWDAGFAVVQVVERSVWAMLGGNSNMAATANTLLKAAKDTGGIGVENIAATTVGPFQPGVLESLSAIPAVCHTAAINANTCSGVGDQDQAKAWELLDKLLIVGANADLDLANGWYIYIMSALYLAVPAVSGQLVLGAKAGMAGMVKDAFQGVGNDAGGAARTGYQHAAVNAVQTNQGSLGQAAHAKSMRTSGLAGQVFDLKNQALDHGLDSARLDDMSKAYSARANQSRETANQVGNAASAGKAMLPNMGQHALGQSVIGAVGEKYGFDKAFPKAAGKMSGLLAGASKANPFGKKLNPDWSPGAGGSGGSGEEKYIDKPAMGDFNYGMAAYAFGKQQQAGLDQAMAASAGQHNQWAATRNNQSANGKNQFAGSVGQQAEFEAQSAAWEAKNAFASHVSSMAGIAGMNSGSLNAGRKPDDMTGMAMSGLLGSGNQKKASYAGTGFLGKVGQVTSEGSKNYGYDYVRSGYHATGILDGWGASFPARVNPDIFLGGASGGIKDAAPVMKQLMTEPGEAARTALNGLNDLAGKTGQGIADRFGTSSISNIDVSATVPGKSNR